MMTEVFENATLVHELLARSMGGVVWCGRKQRDWTERK